MSVKVSGYFGVAAGACGLYIAFAELANETLIRGRVSIVKDLLQECRTVYTPHYPLVAVPVPSALRGVETA